MTVDSQTDPARLDPDDDPATFYRKLTLLSENRLAEEALRFEKYGRYDRLLRFHLTAVRRPEANVRLTHDERRGFHVSSCPWSLPGCSDAGFGERCTCERDVRSPEAFFRSVDEDVKAGARCGLCKRVQPDRRGRDENYDWDAE